MNLFQNSGVFTMKTLQASIGCLILPLAASLMTGCATQTAGELPSAKIIQSATEASSDYKYLIGPGDTLKVFVWGNAEISGSFEVRPDGKITTSLVEDVEVSGKTPTQVARSMEKALSAYIRDPIVSVSVSDFKGPFSEQVRVIGAAAEPRALAYTEHMTLLDVLIQVNGLDEFAAGNSATLLRVESGEYKQYALRMQDLIESGDITANIDILPGDIVIIPETWF